MAITAKKSFTLKKKDLATSKVPAVGFKKIVAYHKAVAGDLSINLTDLTMPTEMSSAGYSNPSTADLMAADLTFFRDNLALVSSARGFLQPGLSYRITSNTNIIFSDSFGTALEDEIFTIIIDPVAKSGVEFVDGTAIPSTGSLPAGQQDFNVGFPFEVNKYSTTQMGAVQVFLDGFLQSRNVGNADADPSADGNYQELPGSGGLGTIIRFNVIDNVNARDVKVVPVGMMLERPSGSTRAELERQQGQINKLIEVVSDVSGSPESTFTAAPSNADLKVFGDRVLGLEEPGSPGIPLVATTSIAGASKKNRRQRKLLTATLSGAAANVTISDLTFNNLIVGNTYQVTFHGAGNAVSGDVAIVTITHNATSLGSWRFGTSTTGDIASTNTTVVKFVATATTLTFVGSSFSVGSELTGASGNTTTWAEIEECNNVELTTAFT